MSFCVALFASCGGNANHDVVKTDKTVVSQAKSKQENKTRTIHVYFFGDFPSNLGSQMIKELRKVYSSVHFEGRISLPDSAYYVPRNRYLAAKLLNTMMTLQLNNDMVLGMTTKDISLKYKEHENWGVMGLSYLNKRAAASVRQSLCHLRVVPDNHRSKQGTRNLAHPTKASEYHECGSH